LIYFNIGLALRNKNFTVGRISTLASIVTIASDNVKELRIARCFKHGTDLPVGLYYRPPISLLLLHAIVPEFQHQAYLTMRGDALYNRRIVEAVCKTITVPLSLLDVVGWFSMCVNVRSVLRIVTNDRLHVRRVQHTSYMTIADDRWPPDSSQYICRLCMASCGECNYCF
jgi:hypothetical protein